ncbi:hypothetical protein [uncultured Cedecea sp.]|uniref:hypothetical protein n=1 Tax=uncultured Cedecea sp. TaxID=988762 RepID=UPI00261E5A4C|nr:hypothetical protein [uncultured Cedecea sp.]
MPASKITASLGTAVMLSVPFSVVTLFALFYLLALLLFPEKQRHSGTVRFLVVCIVLLSVSRRVMARGGFRNRLILSTSLR